MKKLIFLFGIILPLGITGAEFKEKESTQADCDDYTVFCAAQKIGDLAFECINKHHADARVQDLREKPPYEGSRKTSQGLLLELAHENICCLWTPWGRWLLTGAASKQHHTATRVLLTKIKAEYHTHTEETPASGFSYGETYKIMGVDTISLPTPVALDSRVALLHLVENKTKKPTWQEMLERYKKQAA